MATIAEVAAYAGVGTGTVSRVLNDSPKVSPSTRALVLAAIEALEFVPNPLARGLSRGRCHTLGVVVPFFTHASAIERVRGVVAALDASQYDLVLFNVESELHRDEHLASLTRRDRADGLILISLPPPALHLKRLAVAGVPVVLVDAFGTGVPNVVTDDVEGGRMATRHLVDLGHQRIGFIGEDPDNPLGFTTSAKREQGYREVLDSAGLGYQPALVRYGVHDRDVGRRVAEELLDERPRPTAIFASSDVQALGVLEAARAAGMDVPRELSVVGFDDVELSGYAGLTTVRQPLFESGRLGARLLLAALEGRPARRRVHRLPLELIDRATTAPPPARRAGSPPRPRRAKAAATAERTGTDG
jgi:DNA-binding LacI/PurR family transcriptional regulator